jgi:hypothetical protein
MLWMPIISFCVIRAIVNTCFSPYWQNSSIVGKLFELNRSSFHLYISFSFLATTSSRCVSKASKDRKSSASSSRTAQASVRKLGKPLSQVFKRKFIRFIGLDIFKLSRLSEDVGIPLRRLSCKLLNCSIIFFIFLDV